MSEAKFCNCRHCGSEPRVATYFTRKYRRVANEAVADMMWSAVQCTTCFNAGTPRTGASTVSERLDSGAWALNTIASLAERWNSEHGDNSVELGQREDVKE